MAFNDFMHERNIYRVRPNFNKLADKYPNLKQYVTVDSSNKSVLDFKNPKALRELTIACLKNDFDLDVNIPDDRLVPTLPSRLNYILWIEDLLEASGIDSSSNVNGIDIGTGACCIYPLLASQKNGWDFLATEIDPLSAASASSNIKQNLLQSKIKVQQTSPSDTILPESLLCDTKTYDFTMCNPPFYESKTDMASESNSRPAPSSVNTGSDHEIIVGGGEVSFVSRIIQESVKLKDKIKIFTSLLGKKSSLKLLKELLAEVQVEDQTSSELYQGNTMRWVIAWTFDPNIHLGKVKRPKKLLKKPKQKPPLKLTLPGSQESSFHMDDLLPLFLNIISELQMHSRIVKQLKNLAVLKVVAKTNTWSHQRRKRRQQQRLDDKPSTEEKVSMNTETNLKRKLEENEGPDSKKMKIDESNEETDLDALECVLACVVVIKIHTSTGDAGLELQWLRGSLGRDALHQFCQFLKNHLVPLKTS